MTELRTLLDLTGITHVYRWGDHSSHQTIWFLAPTDGLPNLSASLSTGGNFMLPPGPEGIWRRAREVFRRPRRQAR